MKVMLLSDGLYPFSVGGIQRHSQLMVLNLLKEGHSVLVYSTADLDQEVTNLKVLEGLGIEEAERFLGHFEYRQFKFPQYLHFPGHYLKESHDFSKALFLAYEKESFVPDFIYAQGFSSWFFAKNWDNEQIPLIVNFHGFEMYQRPVGSFGKLKNWMLRFPVKDQLKKNIFFISLGPKLSEILTEQGVPGDRIILNPSGIEKSWLCDPESISSTDQAVRFVFVGRYERRKGIEEILEALASFPQIHFDFVGPVPEQLRIQRPNIRYHGLIKESARVKDILDECDILVAPSYSEGLPNVLMEAMARGLALITTGVGANTSLAQEGNSWLVEPANSDSLAEALSSASAIPKHVLLEKKRSSRRIIENFVWPKPVLGLIECVDEILDTTNS